MGSTLLNFGKRARVLRHDMTADFDQKKLPAAAAAAAAAAADSGVESWRHKSAN